MCAMWRELGDLRMSALRRRRSACGEACSRCGKLAWSGRNAEGSPYCAFFAEVGALLVGGMDTGSRHWSPASPFQCLTLECSGQRP
ncbi:hypothetical protein Taro_052080 [Colocasia esculenta]|uniref:Uncharacterized protein n=1 Tax=Colocasia esculenta TaxID=4460 RepID=A0A843XIP3_COLES|nr:hypothetical protein [Colocasia esculenta]